MKSMSIERSTAEGDRTLALVAYVLHLVGAVAGLTSIVGLVINYVKRDRYDELFDSHHSWMIRSFWWALVWVVLGYILAFTIIGIVLAIPLWTAVWVWYAYRMIRGIVDLNANKPMPD